MKLGAVLAFVLVAGAAAGCRTQDPLDDLLGTGEPRFEERQSIDPVTGNVVHEWTDYLGGPDGPGKHGAERTWYPNGQQKAERAFDLGEPVGEWRQWYEDGTLRSEYAHDPNADTTMRFFHPNGALSAEGLARAGTRTGPWSFFYADGTKRQEGAYEAGTKVGRWTLWHPNGGLASRGEYEAGARVGEWRHWDAEPPTLEDDAQ